MDLLQNSFKAVIFDMDGTVLDTIEDIADSMNATLQGLGFPVHPVKRYLDFVGDGIEVLAMKSLPEGRRTDGDVAAGIKAMREEYQSRWSAKTCPYPGIGELLDGLVRLDMKLSILSNKMDSFTKLMAATLLPHWTFIEVRGLTPEVPRKPDPAGALICADRMAVEPSDCIFVGDSCIDMQTAKRAGMAAFGALWGYQDRERLLAGGADVLLNEPGELLGYILRQRKISAS